jgi:hypothetical protein
VLFERFLGPGNTRDFDRFDVLMGDAAVLRIGGAVIPCDPQGTRSIAAEWTSAFPDWRFELLALIAEGDRVVAHMPYRGTHRQAISGVAPTRRSCIVDEIVIFRIARREYHRSVGGLRRSRHVAPTGRPSPRIWPVTQLRPFGGVERPRLGAGPGYRVAMDVIDRLLEGDPAIRWQVLRDLKDASPDEVAAERSRVEHEGWGARLLALEGADGLWDGGACFPAAYTGGEPGQPWTATMHTLQTLQILGLDPASASARRAIALVAEHGRWEHEGQRYFDGEVEPCINGRTIETGAYFGVDVAAIVKRILGERLADGGWNCEAENGSVRSSFDTTINVLDGLLEFDRTTGGSAAVREARRSGEEYLLERGLFRRKSTGEVADPAYLEFAFPYYWHYDVLRALDYFRLSGADPDPRVAEAVEVVRSKRQPDGWWLLDRIHPGRVHFDLEGGVGAPSRWNTLRALRVLDWWDREARAPAGG